MLKTIGIAKNGRYILQPNNEKLLTLWLNDCEGSFVRATWQKVGKSKTTKQLGVHFGLAVEMIRQAMIDNGWDICHVAPNKEMVHEILLKSCGGVGELGATKRLSEMTTVEASKFFENIRAWAATQLGIDIPNPAPNWKDNVGAGPKPST